MSEAQGALHRRREVWTNQQSSDDRTQHQDTADDNLLELIETKVKNGTLTIKPTESISPKSGLKFEIVTPNLELIRSEGATLVEISDLEGDTLKLEIKGASNVTGYGTVNELTVDLKGASSADLAKMISKTTKVDASGACSATVHATASVDVSLKGAGTITVHGKPEDVVKSVQGIGRVKIVE